MNAERGLPVVIAGRPRGSAWAGASSTRSAISSFSTTTALPAQTEGGGVCNGYGGPRLGVCAANVTSAGRTRAGHDRAGHDRAGRSPTSGALPGRSPGSGCARPPFGLGLDSGPRHFEEGMGQQAQRDMPVPPFPAAHLVLVEADLLGPLEALLDHPARPCHVR